MPEQERYNQTFDILLKHLEGRTKTHTHERIC